MRVGCQVLETSKHSNKDCSQDDVTLIQGVGKKEMRSGEQPIVGATKTFDRPGIYSLEVCDVF